MTVRTPLVLVAGVIQQLQPGDSLNLPAGQSYVFDATAIPGQPLYSSAAGHMNLAEANSATTCQFSGISTGSVTSGASGNVQNSGILTLTAAQWNAVTGLTGGLVYNTTYYISDSVAGGLTPTAPTTVGHCCVAVGKANSTTDLQIFDNGQFIQL